MHQITSLEEIADRLAGAKHLVFHPSVSEPQEIGLQLTEYADLWPGLTIETFMPGHLPAYVGDTRLSAATVMPGGQLRKAVNDGLVRPIRESLFEQAQAYENNDRRADVLVLQVSPPDDRGKVSLGPGVGIIPQVLAQNPFVIGVVNAQVPRTNFCLPMQRLDAALHNDQALPSYDFGPSDSIDQRIADLVISQLEPGITVEVGMGGTPDAVMTALNRLDDLHIHTGLINDSIRPVVEAGKLRQPVTTTMAVGSKGFYDWLNNNSQINFQPIANTHDVQRLAQLPRFHAINAALQVDLEGNVNAERIGSRQVSLPGGLPDFAAGARRSTGGCNIIVLRSTTGRTQKSTIVPKVDHKTLDGSMVDMIVTEFGIADLRGMTQPARAEAIISIAKPGKF
ncbi:MAG: acetyl-CoA hydrolase/transferase C-terminal domain-containing protein [Rhizobiaceae bacterium]